MSENDELEHAVGIVFLGGPVISRHPAISIEPGKTVLSLAQRSGPESILLHRWVALMEMTSVNWPSPTRRAVVTCASIKASMGPPIRLEPSTV